MTAPCRYAAPGRSWPSGPTRRSRSLPTLGTSRWSSARPSSSPVCRRCSSALTNTQQRLATEPVGCDEQAFTDRHGSPSDPPRERDPPPRWAARELCGDRTARRPSGSLLPRRDRNAAAPLGGPRGHRRRLGIRHIAVNRPGIGGSDRVASPRTVLEFAGDVEALTEALGVERFMVIGVSAGGPYALAAAHALGGRVLRVAVCSSLSPLCAPHRTPGMPARIGLALSALAAWPRACVTLGDLLLPRDPAPSGPVAPRDRGARRAQRARPPRRPRGAAGRRLELP